MKWNSFNQPGSQQRAAFIFGGVAAILFFVTGILTLKDVGYTWDAPENLLTGEHYVRFFQTFDEQWLDFARWHEIYINDGSQRPPFFNREFNAPFRYPPLANMTAVLTHQLFSEKLNWLPDSDGYHLAVLLFAALLVFVLAVFSWQAFGPLASFAATIALATYPLFFEHAHNNLKDIPFTALVFLALWSYWAGVKNRRWRWVVLSAIATGLALAVRILSAEVWLIIGAAYLPAIWANRQQGWSACRPYKPFLVHIPLALLIFLALWPWLWPDPVGRLSEHIAFARHVSRGLRVLYNGQIWQSGETLPWHYTAVIFLYTTPIVVLIGGLVGGLTAVKRSLKQADAAALMLITLLVISLGRSSWPDIPQYDGSRHMMDGIVAFTALFGLGLQAVWQWANTKWSLPSYLPYLLSILLFLPLLINNVRLHPYQGIFYNQLAGGTTAVFDKYPQEYWGSSFRQGANWINENIGEEHLILPRVGGHLAKYYLRPDLPQIPDEAIPNLPAEQAIVIIYMTRRDKYDWIAEFSEANLSPIFELRRAGIPLLKVVKTDAATLQQNAP